MLIFEVQGYIHTPLKKKKRKKKKEKEGKGEGEERTPEKKPIKTRAQWSRCYSLK